jgi:hypothetical protein
MKDDLKRYKLTADEILNAAEANRRAAVAELALDQHKLPSVLKKSTLQKRKEWLLSKRREMLKQAEVQMSRGLKTFAGQEYVLSVAPGSASKQLGLKIDGTLLASGWRREGDISYLNLNSMAHKGKAHAVGLAIIVPGHAKYEQVRPALALQQAFAGRGLQPNIIRDPALPTNKDIIEISVGPNAEE